MFVSSPNLYIETLSLNEMILEGWVFGKIIGFNSDHEGEALVMGAMPFFFFLSKCRMRLVSALCSPPFEDTGKSQRSAPWKRAPSSLCLYPDREHPALRVVRNKFLLF